MTTWNIDQAHSDIGFKVKHLMVSTVKGMFAIFEGSIVTDDDNFTNAKLSFSADVASLSTHNTQRDGHLMGTDFFDATQFPKITFVSKSFVKKENNNFLVTGDFTMKGITKELTINALFNGIVTDAYGKRVASFEVTGIIPRNDYGITWNAPLATGGVVIGENVMLEAMIEMKEA